MKVIYLILYGVAVFSNANAQLLKVPQDHATIQLGINAAVNGDTVLVSPGTYLENINFRGKNIVVTSRFELMNDLSYIDSIIIDGSDHSDPDTGSVVLFITGEDTSAVLQGFTITGGTGTDWIDQDDGLVYNEGGGVLSEASPTIRFNLFRDNEANRMNAGVQSAGGGAIRVGYGSTRILNNVIISNSGRYGGAIVSFFDNTVIKNNLVVNNSGGIDFGGADIWAGGISTDPVLIENNTVLNNESVLGGGGIRINAARRSSIIRNNIVWGNTAESGGIQISGSVTIAEYNIVEDGFAGATNSSADPITALSGFSSYLLGYDSPVVDGGDPDPQYNDIDGSRNDIGSYGGPAGQAPQFAPIASNLSINSRYLMPGNDNLRLEASILDSMAEMDSAYAEIESPDETLIGQVRLYDDGTHNDGLADDGIFTNLWPVAEGERNFEVDIVTVLSSDGTLIERNNLETFTTIGAVTFSSYETVLNTGSVLFFDVNLRNEGSTETAKTITARISTADSCISSISGQQSHFGDIAAGDSAKSGIRFSVNINQNCTGNVTANIDIEVLSSGVQYWEDNFSISLTIVGVADNELQIPDDYALAAAYPNPFNPSTTIEYSLPKSGAVSLIIFNILGEEIERLVEEKQEAGVYSTVWNAVDLPSGIYFYKLGAGDFSQTGKIVLLK